MVTSTPRVDDSDLSFLSQWTGESDKAALRERVAQHWKGMLGSGTHMYRCMQSLNYLLPRISRHPVYKEMLAAKSSGARFMEVGCAFGTDVRKVMSDGWPAENILALDVTDMYWKFGSELYQDEQKLSGIYTLFGDITDDSFFLPGRSAGSLPSRPEVAAKFLDGKVEFVYAGAVLHVLSNTGVKSLLTKIFATMAPGGVLFGGCVGVSAPPDIAPVDWMPTPDGKGTPRALHTAASLTALAREIGFGEVDVSDVQALFQGVEQERMENKPAVGNKGGGPELEKLPEGVERSYLAFTLRKAR